MKNNLYGGIIKINRKQAEIKLEYISTCTGISKGQLSKIERNREYASHEQIEDIFNVLNLKKHNEDINGQFEKDFYTVDGLKDPYYWEKFYAENVEPLMSEVLSTIISRVNVLVQTGHCIINGNEKFQLALIMMMQLLRGKQNRIRAPRLCSEKLLHGLQESLRYGLHYGPCKLRRICT